MSTPNFQIEAIDGQKYWISRSVAVVVVPLFHCGIYTYIPLGKRGSSMALYPDYWGIPCGFLDWDETASEAVEREVYEELGIRLSDYCFGVNPEPDAVITTPVKAENQTVSLRYIVHCRVDVLPTLQPDGKETTDAKWLDVSFTDWQEEDLAFNHKDIIEWALHL